MGFFRDFRNGLSILVGKPKAGEGDRKLAKMSKIVEAQIPVFGKSAIRTQMVKSIESDLKKAARKGGPDAVEKMIQNALATPEYMHLLHVLGMEEPELRMLVMETTKSNAKT